MDIWEVNGNTLSAVGKTAVDFARAVGTDKITARYILSGKLLPTDYQNFIFYEMTGVDIQQPVEEEF